MKKRVKEVFGPEPYFDNENFNTRKECKTEDELVNRFGKFVSMDLSKINQGVITRAELSDFQHKSQLDMDYIYRKLKLKGKHLSVLTYIYNKYKGMMCTVLVNKDTDKMLLYFTPYDYIELSFNKNFTIQTVKVFTDKVYKESDWYYKDCEVLEGLYIGLIDRVLHEKTIVNCCRSECELITLFRSHTEYNLDDIFLELPQNYMVSQIFLYIKHKIKEIVKLKISMDKEEITIKPVDNNNKIKVKLYLDVDWLDGIRIIEN